MKKLLKKSLAVIIVAAMLICTVPFTAAAESYSGTCGNNLTWSYNGAGTLTISGTGDMTNFSSYEDVPWYFYDFCWDITTVNIASGVTSIGDYAFCSCSSLKKITITENISYIGEQALRAIYLETITVDADNAYFSADSYGVLFNKDKTELVRYPGGNARASYTVPATVSKIDDWAFYYSENLTDIRVASGNSYFSVDNYGVLFNKAKTELVQYPLGNTRTSYVIPDSVTAIRDRAFYLADYLTSITIGAGVSALGEDNLTECYSLASINASSSNNYFSSDSYGVLFNKDKTVLIQYPVERTAESYVIPGSVITVGEKAFYGCALKSVDIGANVTTISAEAFSNCINLKNVNFSDSVESIEEYAFDRCWALQSVIIPDSVKCIGDYAFRFCYACTSIEIGDGVTDLGSFAFYNCQKATNITIGNSVETIGVGAFFGCLEVTSIAIPDSVTKICDMAFDECRKLTTISMPDKAIELGDDVFYRTAYRKDINNWENGALYIGSHLVDVNGTTLAETNYVSGEYTVKSGTRSIANELFDAELTGITIPSTVGYIGEDCFNGCNNLKYIKVNSSNTKYTSDSANVLYDKSKTTLIKYPAASATTSYAVPDTVLGINDNAFDSAVNLKTVTLGSKVEGIGNYAFYGCKALTAISFGNSFESMGEGAFQNCDKITSIILPEKLTEIASDAFYSCDSLASVTIGSNVTEIGARAFAYCRALESITIPGNVESIGLGAFAYCSGVKTAVIEPGVKKIGRVAFGAMTSLEYLHIPSTVTTIDEEIIAESTGYICSDSANSYAISYAKTNGYSYKICSGHGTATPDVPETKTYTLSYNSNGGSGAPVAQSGKTSYTVTSAQPVRSGYTFLGWSKSSTATSASYKAGDSITLTSNTTLYAVWQKNASDPTPDTPETSELPEIKIKRTSTTKINYGDTLVLQLEKVEIPEGYAVAWFVEGAGVSTWVSEDGLECKVTSIANGNPTIYAKLVDADENVITDADGEEIFDEITLTSKAGFWQKFISFFKNLFGINRVIY